VRQRIARLQTAADSLGQLPCPTGQIGAESLKMTFDGQARAANCRNFLIEDYEIGNGSDGRSPIANWTPIARWTVHRTASLFHFAAPTGAQPIMAVHNYNRPVPTCG
jgi:hypothetical protein